MKKHVYREGEQFEYFYEISVGKYKTKQVNSGKYPRITDLEEIIEFRLKPRFTIISEEGKLKKKLELHHNMFRTFTRDDFKDGTADTAWKPV